MFPRLLYESFRRQKRRKLLAGIAILLGTSAITAMLALATTIGDRIHRELAVYGANIVVTPKAANLDVIIAGQDIHPATGNAYLHESDLNKLKTIFWANNITGVSPELNWTGDLSLQPDEKRFPPILDTSGKVHQRMNTPQSAAEITTIPVEVKGLWFDHSFGSLQTGAPQLHPWWKLRGSWPTLPPGFSELTDAAIGSGLATKLHLKIGDTFSIMNPALYKAELTNNFQITGIVTTGDNTDQTVLIPLEYAQFLVVLPGAIDRVDISARTRPEDAFARKDPDTLPAKTREIWYCRPYANSIAYQIQEAIPGAQAQQVRRVEQSEGGILSRIGGLMWLVAIAALLAAAFAVSAAMATAVLERRTEIGLMRSLGAGRARIAVMFYAESSLLALAAGTAGYFAGSLLAWWLGRAIFPGDGTPAILNPVLLPIVLAVALLMAIAGSAPSIRAALRLDPSQVLRGAA